MSDMNEHKGEERQEERQEERFPYMVDGENPEVADVFAALLEGKPVTTKLETPRGTFTMKFPDGKDKRLIRLMVIDEKAGRFDELFSWEDRKEIRDVAMLNVLVVDGPAWWKTKMQKRWNGFPDASLMRDLLARGRLFRLQVERDVAASGYGHTVGGTAGNGAAEAVGGGAFQGLAYGESDS